MKKIFALSLLMAAFASTSAMAVTGSGPDANLTFTGSVTGSTCTLRSGDNNKTIIIPDISVAALNATATPYATQATSTDFQFTNCPSYITKVSATYSYTGSLFNQYNAIASGSANNVLLVFSQASVSTMNSNSYVTIDGSAPAPDVSVINGGAIIPLTVGIQGSGVTTGTYNGTFNVTFNYS